MLSLTFKNLWARKWRSLMTAVAVVFGIALVAGTYVLTDTTNGAFDDIFVKSNEGIDVAITSRAQVEQQDGSTPAFSDKYLKKVEGVDGVKIAAGSLFSQGAILDSEGDSTGGGFAPQFIASELPEALESLEVVEGHRPEKADEVSLDQAAADRSDLKIGDTVQLVGTGKATPFRIVGLTQLGGASFGGTSIAQVLLPQAQKLTGKQGEFDQISVQADPGVSPEELRDRITEVLPKDLRVETGAENAKRSSDDIRESLSFLSIALLAFAAISLFVGSFVIFNVFSITVAQRTREFGMLRTLGAKRGQILRTVLIEGFLIGLVASIVGIVVGIGLAKGLSAVLSAVGADLPTKALVIEPRTIIVSLVIGIGVTLVSSLIPALRSTRVPPIAALSENIVIGGKNRLLLRSIVAALLTVLGIGLIVSVLASGSEGGNAALQMGMGALAVVIAISIFSPKIVRPAASLVGAPLERIGGLTGRLARENSQRNPSRTAVTAAALMIGLALVSFVTIFASGLNSSVTKVIDQDLKGELTLQGPGGFNPISIKAVEAAGKVDGVEDASAISFSQVKVDGGSKSLSSVDPSTINQVMNIEFDDGSPQDLTNLKDGQVIISKDLSDSTGASVGDSISVLSQTGKKPNLTVTGVMASGNLDLLGDLVVTQNEMIRTFGVDTAFFALLKVAPGQDVNTVQKRVEDALDKPFPTADVLNQDELKDSQKQQINGLLAMIYVLLALAVVVSLVGIVVTLILSIYERTRELGMLRAIGMSRRQVKRMVRYEAVITAVLGALAGLILGVIFAFLLGIPLESEGFTLSYPIVTLLFILLLTAVAGVLAAIYPARKAAKLDVLEAVSYE
ncbi:MAG TPA: FtsX-like permease family protein [Solirubrobacterales bacterium]|nr:FtsX-like permease family protein [Solirubrobacterales bacterium]